MTKNVTLGQPGQPRTRGRLRERMPWAASVLDELREVFGAEGIDASIAAGMRGELGFYARENGFEVGTRMTPGVAFEHDGNYWVRVEG